MRNSINRFFVPLLVTVSTLQSLGAMQPTKTVLKSQRRSSFSKKDCRTLIKQLEVENKIPVGLLEAIGAVESEHTPYAVNCNGESHLFTNHEAAKAYVRNMRKRGIIDINIGVLQINFAYHQKRFKNAEDILDPFQNIAYAARYLAYLYKFHGGSWVKAVKFYHSPVAKYQDMYLLKVMNALRKINSTTYRNLAGMKPISFTPVKAAA